MTATISHLARTGALAGAALGLVAGCASAQGDQQMASSESGNEMKKQPDLVTKQEAGKIVYWVTPGPRKLSEEVFGTPENPKMTLKPRIQKAKQMVEAGKMPPSVPQLMKDVPPLFGIPAKARSTTPDGRQIFKHPTPFGDKGRIVEGEFRSEFFDEVQKDTPGKPGDTPDHANMEASFTDPQGNQYRVVLDHVVKPPFPGHKTDGGVMLHDVHHGSTGTGTPLMPQVWTIGALWGISDLYVNGELVAKNRVTHLMTSETVRKTDYSLAQQEEMPLKPSQWHVEGQAHHTHLILPPVIGQKGGPVHKPVQTAFELPNGKTQPFIHVMFEQDTVE